MNPQRRALIAAAAAAPLVPGAAHAASAPKKVLRIAFLIAETGFDPARISDLYSRTVTPHIFESLYRYDYLARPTKVVPGTAAAMPEVSADFRTWTIRIKPGIHFADDPAFKGQRRELVAQDYVYSFKRFFDPAVRSPSYSTIAQDGMLGLEALRERALKARTPFDYDAPVEGLRALDRYTLQFKLEGPRPRFLYTLSDASIVGAVAREVVQAYGEHIMEHPVGTGPFRLVEWRRSSFMALERNPHFREAYYDAAPAPDDAEGQALLARFKGRRLPMVDRVEISVIEESQPRWLAFLNRQFDVASVPLEFSTLAVPNGELAPHLARRGISLHRIINPDLVYFFFNMEDATVGGYTPEKVALRRAFSLAYDVGSEIRLIRRGQAIPAQTIVPPQTYGYDPHLKTEASDYDPARAKALLDLYGYVDRNGDGWREMPDGSPLVLRYASQPSQIDRQFDELLKKCMDRIGVRLQIETAQWPENLKRANAGQLMIWQLGGTAGLPDAADSFETLYGPAAGGQNRARFKLPAFDRLYERMLALPDGPERLALIREANRLLLAYMPKVYTVHRIVNDLTHPWLQGFRRPLFVQQYWDWVDIDDTLRPHT